MDRCSARWENDGDLAEVEVDPDTGCTQLVRYTAVDDFGNLLRLLLMEGQVHGGAVQGIGQVLWEHVVFDEDGQLLTASFMDYAMPRANDIPMLRFETDSVPSSADAMGMKGRGEAGVRPQDISFVRHRIWPDMEGAE